MIAKALSDVFLEYIQPALRYFGHPKPRTQSHDAACALGHVVWNAVILDELDPDLEHVNNAKLQGGNIPEINRLIDMMATHKRAHFSSDQRIIGFYDIVLLDDGSYSFWTQAHDLKQVH
jgi:hypothetical protein